MRQEVFYVKRLQDALTYVIRNTPQLIFKLDETIAYGMKMSKMIDDVLKDSESNEL